MWPSNSAGKERRKVGERRLGERRECRAAVILTRTGIHATRGSALEPDGGPHARHHVAVVHAAHITTEGRTRVGEIQDRDEKTPADGAACKLTDGGGGVNTKEAPARVGERATSAAAAAAPRCGFRTSGDAADLRCQPAFRRGRMGLALP